MFLKLIGKIGGRRAALCLNRPAYRQIKLNTPLSSTLSLGYLADFTKAIKNPMDYNCLLDESYSKVSSTFPAGISLFGINQHNNVNNHKRVFRSLL